jgi:hypothetical protein
MKEGLSAIICIIDRSGSMELIKTDAIGGFNAFLEEQKKLPGEATLTYVQFNHEFEVILENKPLQEVEPITENEYQPAGMTALLDAVGKTIDAAGKRLAAMPEKQRPENVIVAILTDGHENASKTYSLSDVKERITHQKENYAWEFIFLGANQDAFDEAAKIGIDQKDSFHFDATKEGIKDAYFNLSSSVKKYRKRE